MSEYRQQIVANIPRLRRYARALLKDPDRAEDLVQETLVRALDKLHFWRLGSDMRAWLFTIMHNFYINEYRRARKRPDALSLEDAGLPEPSAHSQADAQVQLQDLQACLMRLPEEQRIVLLLIGLEGLSYAATAKVLGIKKGTVMSRLHRARERMRAWMSGASEGNVARIRGMK